MGSTTWPAVSYEEWSATCDTLHGHAQVLGKVAAALAPPEPGYQHIALRLTARGWETAPLPAPDGSGALDVVLDLRTHAALVEHTGGGRHAIPLAPDRAVGEVTVEVLEAVRDLAGPVEIDTKPEEVAWTVPLDEDHEHASYDTDQVASYLAAAGHAALALAAFRAPHSGPSTPVNAWWGSFDLAVSLFDPEDDREFALGWWPGDSRYGKAAFYAYARPAPEGFAEGTVAPEAARWDDGLGEYLLDWDDVRASENPQGAALEFARSAFDLLPR
jgi:hypothetical protein